MLTRKNCDWNSDLIPLPVEAIPARGSVAAQVQTSSPGNGKGTVEMADMAFADIVKTDRLKELKREPELYKQKFFEAYGKYPA